jgi:putative glutamine amidotransferase
MSTPRIGITCSSLRGSAYYGPYARAVEAAGGAAVLLEVRPGDPPSRDAVDVVRGIDGLLLPGGWDIDPSAYGETREHATAEVDPALDRWEIQLVRAAVDGGVPILGICRGQQMINVALGGSLHQHVDGHDMHGHPRNVLAHLIVIDGESELGRVTQSPSMMVNSLHHQSVKIVAPALLVTARGIDGIIEGVEGHDGGVVAVQSHPEELYEEQPWALSLFQRFVDRAKPRTMSTAGRSG